MTCGQTVTRRNSSPDFSAWRAWRWRRAPLSCEREWSRGPEPCSICKSGRTEALGRTRLSRPEVCAQATAKTDLECTSAVPAVMDTLLFMDLCRVTSAPIDGSGTGRAVVVLRLGTPAREAFAENASSLASQFCLSRHFICFPSSLITNPTTCSRLLTSACLA